jgi:CheY-like chemotaxis protein
VDQATDGKNAVEKFAGEAPGFYDAILMDVHMPVMDGYTAAKTIRAMELPHRPRVPIIALSANAFETDVKAALAAGMNAHLAKPIKIPLLMKTLSDLIAKLPAHEPEPDVIARLSAMGCDIETTLRDTYMDNREFYLKMLAKLPESPLPDQMREALGRGDASALFSASHALKGLYASLALTPLHAICSEIVEIARAGSTEGVSERLERLEKMHRDVLEMTKQQETDQ